MELFDFILVLCSESKGFLKSQNVCRRLRQCINCQCTIDMPIVSTSRFNFIYNCRVAPLLMNRAVPAIVCAKPSFFTSLSVSGSSINSHCVPLFPKSLMIGKVFSTFTGNPSHETIHFLWNHVFT